MFFVQRRKIVCSLCARSFQTKGTTRVLHKVVFQFCASCWGHKQAACEQFAQRVAA